MVLCLCLKTSKGKTFKDSWKLNWIARECSLIGGNCHWFIVRKQLNDSQSRPSSNNNVKSWSQISNFAVGDLVTGNNLHQIYAVTFTQPSLINLNMNSLKVVCLFVCLFVCFVSFSTWGCQNKYKLSIDIITIKSWYNYCVVLPVRY